VHINPKFFIFQSIERYASNAEVRPSLAETLPPGCHCGYGVWRALGRELGIVGWTDRGHGALGLRWRYVRMWRSTDTWPLPCVSS